MTDAAPETNAAVGDTLIVTGHRVGEAGRTGEILEVLFEHGREHYRVRWEDEHESIFYPSSDAIVRAVHAGREEES